MNYFIILVLLLFNTGIYAQISRKTDLQTGKMGFVDASGNTLVPLEYDFLPFQYAPKMVARKGDKRGVIDDKGQTIVPFDYHTIQLEKNGFALVSKDKSKQPVLGLLDSAGKVVLPLAYEYVAVLDSQLLAARLFNSKEIAVFDKNGKQLFKTEGNNAMPGFGDSTVLIQKANRTTYWVNLRGAIITPAKYAKTEWSDGDYFIVYQNNFGVLNDLGDTVVPFLYRGIKPLNKGHFAATDSSYRNFLLNNRGQILAEGEHSRLGDQEGDGYFKRWGTEYTSKLYDASGKLLLENCTVYPVSSAPYGENLPENHSDRYSAITVKETGLRAFYRADGVQMLPPLFKNIHYATDRHPLIAFKKNEKTGKYTCTAYDFNGEPLMEQRFAILFFTDNPRYFTGKMTHDGPWGFIDLLAPEKSEFLYQNMERQPDGTYHAFQNGKTIRLALPGTVLPPAPPAATDQVEPPVFLVEAMTAPPIPDEVTDAYESSQQASFPGGETAQNQFVVKNMKYPEEARKNGTEGTVVISFVVEKDGSLSEIKLLRDIGDGCGQEAIRMVSMMPKWVPGKNKGQPVKQKMFLPVKFKM
ncbi:MAG: TonB family protein [Saprospiraceae bacterium]|nr:TonB family protein [Saprospiraceae bacterium]